MMMMVMMVIVMVMMVIWNDGDDGDDDGDDARRMMDARWVPYLLHSIEWCCVSHDE
jgi:hypothetical protein